MTKTTPDVAAAWRQNTKVQFVSAVTAMIAAGAPQVFALLAAEPGLAAELTLADLAPGAEAPKKTGRPPKAKTDAAPVTDAAPKKRGRPPKAKTDAAPVTDAAPKKRGRPPKAGGALAAAVAASAGKKQPPPRVAAAPEASAKPRTLETEADRDAYAKDILKALKKSPEPMAISEIVAIVGGTNPQAGQAIHGMREAGTVVRTGEKRGTRYHAA